MDDENIRFTPKKEEMLKAAIGELLELAVTTNVKKALDAYSYAKGYSTNLEKMKNLPSSILEECAVFLKLEVRDGNNTKTYKNKQVLADRVIMKIESHFEEQCDECSQSYRIRPGSPEPFLRCFLCMQGCHDCEDITARFERSSQEVGGQLTGSVWLCRGCRVKNDIFGTTRSQKTRVTFDNENSNKVEPDVKDDTKEGEEKEEEEEETTESERPSPRRDRQEQGRHQAGSKMEICPLYKKRQCPHGVSGQNNVEGKVCQLAHPRKCLKFCRFGKRKGGCLKGSSCKYYHPVLCKFSVRSNKCYNSECTFTHLKGTKRPQSGDRESMHHHTIERKEIGLKPQRLRKDSIASVGSRNSECFRTPFPRKRTESEKRNPVQPNAASNDFLEKLMENMRQGFEQQKTEIGMIKQEIDKQIDAIWKKVGSVSQSSLPQLPIHLQQQLPPQMIPATQNQAPWNVFPNQCSMY